MPAAAYLQDIVDALEMQFDESLSFLDRETGQVETVSKDLLNRAEEPEDDQDVDLPECQTEEWELAKLIVSSGDRFLDLPSKFDVHEWAIMEEFSQSVKSASIREDLLHAIHGAGAFRNFKYLVKRHGIDKTWFAFRTEALRQIALDWCEENQIELHSDHRLRRPN
jgi:hypothetical protein